MEIVKTREQDYAFVMNRQKLDHLVEAVESYIEKWSGKIPNYYMNEFMEIENELRAAQRQ